MTFIKSTITTVAALSIAGLLTVSTAALAQTDTAKPTSGTATPAATDSSTATPASGDKTPDATQAGADKAGAEKTDAAMSKPTKKSAMMAKGKHHHARHRHHHHHRHMRRGGGRMPGHRTF